MRVLASEDTRAALASIKTHIREFIGRASVTRSGGPRPVVSLTKYVPVRKRFSISEVKNSENAKPACDRVPCIVQANKMSTNRV